MSRKTLLVICPIPNDGTSFYRGVGVWPRLQADFDVQMHNKTSINWAALSSVDAVMMQRPATPGEVEIARLIKKLRIPLIVDYDDDLFSVPLSNPVYFRLHGDEPACVREMLKLADVVTVTTRALADKLTSEGARDVRIVQNAIDTRVFNRRPDNKREKIVTWRGSGTHDKDLYMYTQQIVECANKHPDWKFIFMGEPLWLTLECMPKDSWRVVTNQSPVDYMNQLMDLRPAIHMVPLWDCAFNRSKSNLAWAEAHWAGATVLAPDWPEWQKPHVVRYDSAEKFGSKLSFLMNQPAENMFTSLWAPPVLDTENVLRGNIINELWGN